MIQNRALVLNRGEAFLQCLKNHLYQEVQTVEMTVYHAPGRVTFDEAMNGTYTALKVGDKLAPNWSTHWVKINFTIPKTHEKNWHLRWHSRSEACVWHKGETLQAFSPDHRTAFPLKEAFCNGKKQTLYLEVAVNNLFGAEHFADRMPWMGKGIGTVELAEVAAFREDVFQLMMDFSIIFELAKHLPETSQRAQDAMYCFNQIINLVYWENPQSIKDAIEFAKTFLNEKASPSVHQLSAIGHAHLDLAWLWPVAESKRKAYRTISTAIANMERYPNYKFICSQMQVWSWIKTSHPKLYSKMIDKVKQGQLIPCGGSWVEPDCNLPSLESLLRQFIFGQRFMQDEFGFKSKVFWNPDVFGYSAQLPQILKICEIDYFLTQKMSWNQFNRFPHTSFIWEGLDGSSVLAHFPPADNYNCSASVQEVLFNVSNHKSGDATRESYMLYGFGDGGSGPTEEMLERIERMKNLDGLPQVKHRTPNEFFKRLEKDRSKFRTWVGELYLELHRGCQTTQAHNKLFNRKCEQLLREVEQLYSSFDMDRYPTDVLKKSWELLLLNQFHDILPGSSIQEAYRVTREEYTQLHATLLALKEQALKNIAGKKGKNLLYFNPHNIANKPLICPVPKGVEGAQKLHTGEEVMCICSQTMLGIEVVTQQKTRLSDSVSAKKTGKIYSLENKYVVAQIDIKGHLVSFYDKLNQKQLIQPSAFGNHLRLFDDTPNYWDAWDIEAFYREKEHAEPSVKSIEIVDNGPLVAQIKIYYVISDKSSLTQTILLDAVSPLLTFKNEATWFEKHRLLKVEFPWNVHAQQAAYEIQGGFLHRNTHENTSWDIAQFEVCGHRWADFSAPDYGVALLNDSKYGYHTLRNRMTLSLIRGCEYPDPQADEGEHVFTYAIYPHAGATATANLHQIADILNMPPIVCMTSLPVGEHALFKIENGDNIEFTAIKKGEASNHLVVRFYETSGLSHPVKLKPMVSFKSVCRTNALEEKSYQLHAIDNTFMLDIKPFEIVTLVIER